MTIRAAAEKKEVAKISSTHETRLVYHRIIWHGVRQRDVVVVFAGLRLGVIIRVVNCGIVVFPDVDWPLY